MIQFFLCVTTLIVGSVIVFFLARYIAYRAALEGVELSDTVVNRNGELDYENDYSEILSKIVDDEHCG